MNTYIERIFLNYQIAFKCGTHVLESNWKMFHNTLF